MGLIAHFVLGVGVVFGLLWASARIARRYGSAGTARAGAGMRVVARRQLGKGVAVVRLGVEDKDLLLGCSPKGVDLLCELPASAPEPAEQRPPSTVPAPAGSGGFAATLARALGAHRRP